MKSLAIELLIFCLMLTTTAGQVVAQDGNRGSVTVEIGNDVDSTVINKVRSKTEAILKNKTAELRRKIDQYQAMRQRGEIGAEEMERRIQQDAARFEQEIDDEVANLEFVIERELAKSTGNIDIHIDDDLLQMGDDIDVAVSANEGNDDWDEAAEAAQEAAEAAAEAYEATIEASTLDSIGEDRKFKIKLPSSEMEKGTHTGIALAFGWNGVVTDKPAENAYYPEFKTGKSGYFEIGYAATTRLGKPGSKLYLNYGLVYNHLNFEMPSSTYLTHVDNTPIFVETPAGQGNFKKSELNVNYLTIPLTLRLGTKGYRGFGVEAGGYVGVRIGTNQLRSYESNIDEEVEVLSRHKYGMNRFNAGVTASLGWRWIGVFAKYDLTPLFKETSVYDYQPLTAGIRFNLM